MDLLFVVIGGAVGTAFRYLTVEWAERALGSRLPWGTLLVNVIGSFVLGFLVARFRAAPAPSHVRLGLTTGFTGGFTTYSAFNVETIRHLQAGAFVTAGAYVAITLVVCLVAGAAGMMLARATT